MALVGQRLGAGLGPLQVQLDEMAEGEFLDPGRRLLSRVQDRVEAFRRRTLPLGRFRQAAEVDRLSPAGRRRDVARL